MSRFNVVLMVISAVMVFSALSVASASAGWLINGTTLTSSAALNTQALVDENSTILIPVLKLSIQCSGHFLDELKPQIFGTDKGYAEALTFLGCNTIEPAGCALKEANEPISTLPILALAAKGVGETVKLTFTPETKSTFTNVRFGETNTCAFNGEEPVTGAFVAGAPTGALSLLAQALTGLGSTEGNNSLQIAGDKLYLDGGRALLKLVSDSKWSFD